MPASCRHQSDRAPCTADHFAIGGSVLVGAIIFGCWCWHWQDWRSKEKTRRVWPMLAGFTVLNLLPYALFFPFHFARKESRLASLILLCCVRLNETILEIILSWKLLRPARQLSKGRIIVTLCAIAAVAASLQLVGAIIYPTQLFQPVVRKAILCSGIAALRLTALIAWLWSNHVWKPNRTYCVLVVGYLIAMVAVGLIGVENDYWALLGDCIVEYFVLLQLACSRILFQHAEENVLESTIALESHADTTSVSTVFNTKDQQPKSFMDWRV